ncbi:hypothetical protein ACQ4PT_065505 [Festuca glaucescens]
MPRGTGAAVMAVHDTLEAGRVGGAPLLDTQLEVPSPGGVAALGGLATRRAEATASGSFAVEEEVVVEDVLVDSEDDMVDGDERDLPHSALRGRSASRPAAPQAVRRCSRASLTTPTSPDSVIPSSAVSRKMPPTGHIEMSPTARSLCSPSSMLDPLHELSPARPPGFSASPSSHGSASGPPGFTPAGQQVLPLLLIAPEAKAHSPHASINTDALFVPAVQAILQDPAISPRPAPPANHRKTLAAGFSVRQSSIRIQGAHRGVPIAKMVERNLLRKLGIVDDDDEVTPEAINDFVQMFRTKIPPQAVAALRAMSRFDCEQAGAVEDALLAFGGQGALDQDAQEEAAQV